MGSSSLDKLYPLGETSDTYHNSSTTALSGGATFTGTGELNYWPNVIVSCKTDAAGTLYFDFSNDGTNWESFPTSGFTVSAGIHEFHSAVKGPRWFRARLVNGASAQTYLRLYTHYTLFVIPNAPLNQSLGSDSDAVTVRPWPSEVDLALGKLGGAQSYTRFGSVTGIDALDNPIDVWEFGNDTGSPRADTKTFPSSTFTPYLASSNNSDTVDVYLEYMDANNARQSTTVTLTGQTGVSAGVTAKDITRMYVDDTTALLGNVTCLIADNFTSGVAADTSQVVSYMTADHQQTQQSFYYARAGYKTILTAAKITLARGSGAAGSANAHIMYKPSGKVARVVRDIYVTNGAPYNDEESIVLSEGDRLWVRIQDVSDTDTDFFVKLDFIEVPI